MLNSIDDWLAAGDDADPALNSARLLQPLAAAAPAAPDGVSALQILRDRPDVYAAYYREYFGDGNDRHSDAWANRVGGTTPEDFAIWWYRTYGEGEGYTPSEPAGFAAPAEDAAYAGRTTIDGIPLAQILADRPDVFQAYFTSYYGPNNDHHSDAWVQRVGGTSIEDFADYWYNAYGKLEGYRPSISAPQPDPEPSDPTPSDPEPIPEDPPAAGEDDDGVTVGPPADDGGGDDLAPPPEPVADAIDIARALIVTYTDDGGVELVPATLEQMRTLFDDAVI